MLQPADIARELVYPLRHASLLFSWLALFLVIEFAMSGGVLGLLLLLLVLPSFFRYLMRVLDARARGADVGPLEVDDLLWFGNAWSLFVIVHVAVVVYATYFLGSRFGIAAAFAADLVLAVLIPASLAVLAITRNPVESLTPGSVWGVIDRCGAGYWMLPTYLILGGGLVWWLSTRQIPAFWLELFATFLVFAFFALLGAVVRPHRFYDEVMIRVPVEPDQEVLDANLLQERTGVLNHAYGFISRGNRAGGFKHIRDWLETDPDPDGAWAWFLEQMLAWENPEPAQVYAQTYLSRLLQDRHYTAAVKLMMRCRLLNDAFGPRSEDREIAIAAAQHCGNEELVRQLQGTPVGR